jgi:class 3 adenylate cyclase/Tfp pilus assembly protein PilF
MKKIFIQCILILFLSGPVFSSQADSLFRVLERSNEDSLKVNTLISLAATFYRSNPDSAILYAEQAISLADKIKYTKGLAYAYKGRGMGFYFQGKYAEALNDWEISLEYFRNINDLLGVSNMLNNLGAVYYNYGENNTSITYYLESLKVSEKIGDSLRIATALVNIGAVYYSKEATHDLALEYYSKALPMSEALGDFDAIGTSAVNLGQIYLDREDDVKAEYYFTKALEAYENSENGNVSYAMMSLGRVYALRKDYVSAVNYQQGAYDLAENNNSKLEMAQAMLSLADTYDQTGETQLSLASYKRAQELSSEIGASYVLKDSYNGLALAYAKLPDYQNAYRYQLLYNEMKDTLYNAEMDRKVKDFYLIYEIEKQQGQIDLLTKDQELANLALQRQKIQRNAVSITGVLLLLIAIGLMNRYRYVRKTKKIIEHEKDRSEQLLLNVLPAETAEELKEKGSATPKHYDMVTVLFTDFKGFTRIAEKLTPAALVAELDYCFHAFDKIIDKHKIEKIKTIGDAYMCAGGIPVANTSNPADVVRAGIEIREFMEQLKIEKEARGEDYWELRIGIHTGSVIAGVVGKNKFAYDIWGDAVNLASRMESSGIPGKVNISGNTYELVKDLFRCTFRGQIQAKNKGEIDMYIVEEPANQQLENAAYTSVAGMDKSLRLN